MTSSGTAVDELNEYGRVNAVLEKFFQLPTWTPAMGAMLISGVLPGPASTDIPDVASQLKNPALPASDKQLRQARDALRSWVQDHSDEDDETVQVPSQTSPLEYLIWCEESYGSTPNSMRPSWLNYFLALIQSPLKDGAPHPAPVHLVARALELERFAAVVRDTRNSHAATEAPSPAPEIFQVAAQTVRKNVVTKPGKANPIEREISIAQAESNDPFDALEVWACLSKMAKTGRYPKLVPLGDGRFQVPTGKGLRVYTVDALRKFIGKPRRSDAN